MNNVVFRRGSKVILRPIEESDVPNLTQWINDPETTKFLMIRYPMSTGAERAWVEGLSKHNSSNVVLAIDTLEGVHIGSIGLHSIDWIHRRATTGTIIGNSEYRGKGYGTDAKMLLLDYAFNELQLHKVCSSVIAFNKRSRRYSERCGYTVEATLKNHHFHAGKYHDEIRLAVFKKEWLPLWREYQKTL